MTDTYAFDREHATYKREKERLLEFEGDYVVIHGEEVLGHWEDGGEAFDAGRAAYGEELFLLRTIDREDPIYFFPYFPVE